jgi:biotin carboxylase
VEGPDAERTARLVALLGWQGMFMIELLRDHSGRAWFMELNGRAWGSMALAREMGFEYPAWAVQQLLRPEFDPTTPAPRPAVVCRHLGRELIHLLMVFRGPKSSAYVDWPARFGTFRSVLTLRRSDRWYNQRPGANRIFLDDAWQTVRGQLSRGRRA